MARITPGRARKNAFDTVRTVGLLLPGVQATTRYDGSPVLKLGGCFMAGLATHRSAEPDSLVVRVNLEERELLLDEAPETYYLTDDYRRYPIVLVRLSGIDRDALRDPQAPQSGDPCGLPSVEKAFPLAAGARRPPWCLARRGGGTAARPVLGHRRAAAQEPRDHSLDAGERSLPLDRP